jgi:hypothetical protein
MTDNSKYYRKPTETEQCTAISKQSGNRCTRYAVKGMPGQKCCMHGSGGVMSKNRIRHELATSGVNLNDKVEQLMNDPEILNLKKEIAMMKVMRDECWKKVQADNITEPATIQMINFLSQSITKIATGMSTITRNLDRNLDAKTLLVIMAGLKISFVDSVKSVQIEPDKQKLLVDTFFEKIDKLEIIDNE